MVLVVSNDPSWWPLINVTRIASYFVVASSAAVMYDWALTFAQEVELIWRQRWSLMTFMYLGVRYLGLVYAVNSILFDTPTISLTVVVSLVLCIIQDWTTIIVIAILGAIMIARLYAMYQGSRKVLILLIVVFLPVNVVCGVITVISIMNTSAEELILSGIHLCTIDFEGDVQLLNSIPWMLTAAWEILALCLAAWIAVKHFRELRRHSTGGSIGDCFTVLMTTHVVYFVSAVAVSCFQLGYLSPALSASYSPEVMIYDGIIEIFVVVQMFVLGPRLILSVREYNAKLVADSDAATAMTSIAFQERVHVATSSSV
ncbi:uncharacterized protein EDB91DRAFT_206691 [Suillus paluster]|uniref:uncharacterized protein n=1 Tax=Suillus paluster TaxID=48578 RepID=UPI001B86F8D0|nr:uncharacterized protein EDB91DRAFT_206691 [Suillus paluster]KAG1743991.1 hypothetical protein EDB91DRAFT_206691 [Suillus paluster]